MERSTTSDPRAPLVSREGVDLTQIRALKRLTPSERLDALTQAANNLLKLRRSARRADVIVIGGLEDLAALPVLRAALEDQEP